MHKYSQSKFLEQLSLFYVLLCFFEFKVKLLDFRQYSSILPSFISCWRTSPEYHLKPAIRMSPGKKYFISFCLPLKKMKGRLETMPIV